MYDTAGTVVHAPTCVSNILIDNLFYVFPPTSVQQMTVMIMFPVSWPAPVREMGAIFEGFSFDISIVSPT